MSRVFVAPIIGQSAASGAQVIDGSLKFDDGASNQLRRTPTVDGNKKTWTWSGWVKRNLLGSEQVIFGVTTASNNYAQIYIDSSDQLTLGVSTSSIGNNYIVSTRKLRDTGWYHIVAVFDSSDSTQADRLKLYVNGERITSFSASSIGLSENTDGPLNDNVQHVFSGKEPYGSGQQLDGNLSQCYLIDGQALTPDSFGFTDPLTNTWKPKKFNVSKADDTVLVGSPTYASSDFKTEGNKTSDQTGLSFGAWTSYTGAETKIFKNSTDTVFTLNLYLTGGTTDRLLWYSNNLTDWTFVGNTNPNRYYQLSGFKYYATSEGSASTTLEAISKNGPNSFYLPFDGNSSIGKDQSGNGNDFTPVNFGGSVALDSPAVSGGRPFLNVTQGGTQAGVGVFGSKENQVYTVTYADDGGGNKYYIDGVKQPTLNGLIRGSTYTFDTVALGSTHPFRLSATSAHGSEYTDGVIANTGAATTITIPHNAPDSLYYYCTAHSGMGSSITGITTNEKLADPYASNCVLAVSFSGGRYQDDSSLLNCTTPYYSVSSEGNINSGISTISNFYATSLYFDGSGDYYTTPGSNTSELGMGTGDFTIETWIYPTALASSDFIVNLTAADSVFGYDSDGTLNIQLPSSGAPALTQKGPKIVANKWNHFAVVRESGAVRGYIDGVLAATVTDTTDMGSTGKAVIGSHATLSREITGYLQDLRIYKGIAKYTSDFVVAATSPDVLPDTPSGVSGSSKLAKIIDGAVRFDGTGDLLSVPDSDDFNLGTNDFTIEYFVYKNSTQGTSSHHVSQYGTSNANRSFAFRSVALPFTDLQFRWYNGSNEYTMNWSEGWMRAQEGWKHICVQRKSGVMYLYIDGKLWKTEAGASAALSINNSTAPLTIGGDSNTGSEFYLNGSISNFRFINGTAIYRTGGFVSPIAPLTTTSQGATESEVKLLCCQSNTQAGAAVTSPNMGGINDGTNWTHFLTTNAGDNFDASGPKYYAFDGNGSNKAFTGNNSDGTTQGVSHLQVNFPNPISGALRVKCDNGNEVINVTGQDVGIGTQSTGSDNQFVDCGTVSNLTNLRVLMAGGSRPAISIVEVDGVNLVDPASPIGDVAATNFNPFNTDINTVRGQETTGYATFNPLRLSNNAPTLSENNLTVTAGGSAAWYNSGTTIDVSSGKWFWEVYPRTVGGSGFTIGVALEGYEWNRDTSGTGLPWLGSATGTSWSVYSTGQKYFGASGTNYMDAFTTSDVIGVALDVDANTLTYYQNGISKGVAFSDVKPKGKSLQIGLSVHGTGSNKASINFGQKPFRFPPPEGFQPLNLANTRPVKVISRPDQYVGITTWKGNATSGRRITGLNFNDKPDLIWIKNRGEDIDHTLYDSVRGFGANKELTPNGQYSEGQTGSGKPNSNAWGYVNSNNFNGFTVNNGSSGQSLVNNNNIDYVAWCWKAGGNSGNFNIDHVGYSTAGDAAMSIADQNTTGYNTDQNWGSGATGEINPGGGALESGCFNGNFSDSINSKWGDTSKAITYTFNNLPFKKIRFYAVAQNVSNSYVRFNGVAQTQARIRYGALKFGWFEAVDVPSPLNKIEVYTNGSSDFISLYAVEVDGKILVNSSGVTPPNLPSIPATGASVGTEQGFSIVTYTGTGSAGTIPHRLTQDPEFVIFKQRNNEDDWRIFHKDLDPDEAQDFYLMLQSTNGKSADQNQSFMNRVPPTGPVIHLGTDSAINGSSTTMVAYSWHSVPGLQKFGKYSGNSNADGAYVELGFRPALLWLKRTDSTGSWVILDTKRNPNNPVDISAYANSASDANYSPGQDWADIFSTGFKLRATYSEVNTGSYIYCAWAEAPSIDLYGGGANAR